MSILERLAEDPDFQSVSEETPLIPEGTYHALLTDFEEVVSEEEEYPRIVLTFTLQDNPGITFPDGSPVDGAQVQYSLFLPKPEDKMTPARFGRGTEWDSRVRRIKRTLRSLGCNPEGNLVEELRQACGAAFVAIDISHKTNEEGETFERVQRIRKL